eukprot:3293305-Pyramimonas_sp.AAC.1
MASARRPCVGSGAGSQQRAKFSPEHSPRARARSAHRFSRADTPSRRWGSSTGHSNKRCHKVPRSAPQQQQRACPRSPASKSLAC